jgi:hypothetical protein
MYKGKTTADLQYNLMQYMKLWKDTEQEYNNWKCRLWIIGIFFSIRVSNKLGRITKEYSDYLDSIKNA